MVLILWIICAFLGYNIGKDKKMGPIIGFFLGLLFSILGVIIVLLSANNDK